MASLICFWPGLFDHADTINARFARHVNVHDHHIAPSLKYRSRMTIGMHNHGTCSLPYTSNLNCSSSSNNMILTGFKYVKKPTLLFGIITHLSEFFQRRNPDVSTHRVLIQLSIFPSIFLFSSSYWTTLFCPMAHPRQSLCHRR